MKKSIPIKQNLKENKLRKDTTLIKNVSKKTDHIIQH